MKKYNFVLLGIAISYVIVAVIQLIIPTPLSASVYITISFLSLEISIFELIKSIIEKLNNLEKQRDWIIENELSRVSRAISVFESSGGLEKEIEELNIQKSKLEKAKKNTKIKDQNIKMKKVKGILTAFEIVFCTIQVIITPLKVIPYDSFSTKVLNCLSIVSFAFLFFSLFVLNMGNIFPEIKEKLDIEESVSNYYLSALEKSNKHESE